MDVACIDLEGVLIPEMWPHIARATGIAALAVTTREEPDYSRLVETRIRCLRSHCLRLADVQSLVATMQPLPGATDFLAALQAQFHIVLVSDAFQDMLLPLWNALGKFELRCHRFICDAQGYIQSAQYIRAKGKHEVVEEFTERGFRTLAVGDAFNDLSMLRSATTGFLFCPSPQTLQCAQGLNVAMTYAEISDAVSGKGRRYFMEPGHKPVPCLVQRSNASSTVITRPVSPAS